MEMYGRIKNDQYMNRRYGSKKFRGTKIQNKSIVLLHNALRNKFIHFTPKSWSVYVPIFLSVVRELLPVISFLAFESGNIVWWGPKDELIDATRTSDKAQ